MRLATFEAPGGAAQAGVLVGQAGIAPLAPLLHRAGALPQPTPLGMLEVLERWRVWEPALRGALEGPPPETLPLARVRLRAPLPRPRTIRDFYAFEAHVVQAWKRRGAPVPREWYEAPVFYFTNPDCVLGPEDEVAAPRGSRALDYELEVAWVVGEPLRDPTPEEAQEAIVALTILNDWSARDLQRREMAVGLGPSKGKDFATSLGPWLVTVDELEDRRTPKAFGLAMEARLNGEVLGRGNLADVHWSLGRMTAHAAADATLRPGDVLATGTMGGGSLLDLGREPGDYLKPGDEVELRVERLGALRNRVKRGG